MLELRSIRFAVKDRVLVDGVSLALPAGSTTAIVGPNGAGKSTLLKLATGSLVPTHGTVNLDGRPVHTYPKTELAKRRAVLSQSVQLPFPYTVREVIGLGRVAVGGGPRETAQITEQLLDALGLEALAERAYDRLSGGEQQRVQLGRVLAQITAQPGYRVLFLDEPTASLDLKHQHRILAQARALLGPQVALVAVVHDLNLATAYFDQIVFLKNGRCAACGAVDATVTQAIVEHVFEQPVTVRPHPVSGRPFIIPHTTTLHAEPASAPPSEPILSPQSLEA